MSEVVAGLFRRHSQAAFPLSYVSAIGHFSRE